MEHLKGVLEQKLADYNENVSSMNLVLFDQAMEHICRIARGDLKTDIQGMYLKAGV